MDISEAVRRYLAPQPNRYLDNARGEPSQRDVQTAARLAGEWRREGPLSTASILYTLHTKYKMSHGKISDLTGIATTTVGRLIEDHRRVVASGG